MKKTVHFDVSVVHYDFAKEFCKGFYGTGSWKSCTPKNATLFVMTDMAALSEIPKDKLFYIMLTQDFPYKSVKKVAKYLSKQYKYSVSNVFVGDVNVTLFCREDTACYPYNDDDCEDWVSTKDFSMSLFDGKHVAIQMEYYIAGNRCACYMADVINMENAIKELRKEVRVDG